ncbi:hypothetical protein ACWIG3_16335 [Streptomyces celluloflavus]|uniref:Small CPxCG-related zinc finger protein n=1 Tax=Streptomyces celluloflavus TaxID=58344 RepID=A0ABW7RHT3_9ACTN|nr:MULTISPECIES: hypothetical protein [Streptomyces]MYU54129.1 hypothetical protein [Streptomyces sp. SID7805]
MTQGTEDTEVGQADSELYYTTHRCSSCGSEVHGLHGRWTCSACGTCSPYSPPPDGWQADDGYDSWS